MDADGMAYVKEVTRLRDENERLKTAILDRLEENANQAEIIESLFAEVKRLDREVAAWKRVQVAWIRLNEGQADGDDVLDAVEKAMEGKPPKGGKPFSTTGRLIWRGNDGRVSTYGHLV